MGVELDITIVFEGTPNKIMDLHAAITADSQSGKQVQLLEVSKKHEDLNIHLEEYADDSMVVTYSNYDYMEHSNNDKALCIVRGRDWNEPYLKVYIAYCREYNLCAWLTVENTTEEKVGFFQIDQNGAKGSYQYMATAYRNWVRKYQK